MELIIKEIKKRKKKNEKAKKAPRKEINKRLLPDLPPGLDWMNPKFSSLFAVSSEKALTQNDNVSLPNFMMDKTKVNIENLRMTKRKKLKNQNPKF